MIIDADQQFRRAEERIAEAIERHLPAHMREGFIFHAKDVFGKHKKAEGWSLAKCYQITEAWIDVITSLGLPWGVAWWSKAEAPGNDYSHPENVIAHMAAFAGCLQVCDEMVAMIAPGDVAAVIAEDCPQMRAILKRSTRDHMAGSMQYVATAFARPITHIKNAVQFCDKEDAVLLQLADVCAYSFKRYVTGSPGGDRLLHTLKGKPDLVVQRDFRNVNASHLGFGWKSY